MAYYEILKLRERTLGDSDNDSQDDLLNNFGAQADSKIDRMIKSTQLRLNNTTLPVVPLSTVPQDIKDAATDLAASYYFTYTHNLDMAKIYKESAMEFINGYVGQVGQDDVVYGMAIF